MKLAETKHKIKSSGVISQGQFGISTGDQAHILSILRDKLYSNKVLAVIREYSTNALDAQLESQNPDTPIEVTLPTQANPIFKVRDFGSGLSNQAIYEVYTQYGRSTKRDSNLSIGQLGLGCKSGFAYSNSFSVTSWHQELSGKRYKRIYIAYIDETNLGAMSMLSEEETTEPTGIEISIAVKIQDINEFSIIAQNFFAYFPVLPRFHGSAQEDFSLVQYTQFSDQGWGLRTRIRIKTAQAIMGNIAYPINLPNQADTINSFGRHISIYDIANAPFDLYFNIGDLSIAASREALEYTPDTIKTLEAKLRLIQDNLLKELQEDLNLCKTLWEARLWRRSRITVNAFPYGSMLFNLLANSLTTWQGKSIINSSTTIQNLDEKLIVQINRYNKKFDNIDGANSKTFYIDTDSFLLIPDIRNWRDRVIYNKGSVPSNHYLVVSPKEDLSEEDFQIALNEFVEQNQLDGIPIIKASSLAERPKEDRQTSTNLEAQKKARCQLFKLKPDFVLGRYPASDNWEVVKGEPQNKVYVMIDRFSVSSTVTLILNALEANNFSFECQPIYGIREKDLPNLDTSWKSLESIATEIIIGYLSPDQKRFLRLKNSQASDWYNARETIQLIQASKKIHDPELSAFLSAIQNDEEIIITRAKLDSIVESYLGKDPNFTSLFPPIDEYIPLQAVREKYPLLLTLGIIPDVFGTQCYAIHYAKNNWLNEIINYINLKYKEV